MLNSVNIGDIVVKHFGYSMVLYNFYKVIRTTKTQMILMPLMKTHIHDDSHDGFHPIVKPLDMQDSKHDLIRCKKNSYEYTEYDPNYNYVEDHLD